MSLKKICIMGHYAFGKELANGQTVKTKIVTEELCRQFGEDEILKIDTHGGAKTLFKAPFQAFKALKTSKNVIILPAHNGLRIYAPLLSMLKGFFGNRKLHYVVIGGWLPKFLKNKRLLAKQLKRFDGIYVETNTMKKALIEQGFENVIVMPNCKKLRILDESELVYQITEPYKLCTFSRVDKQKGIEDAIDAVKAVNDHFGRTVYTLDIYGQVDNTQTAWFDELKNSFPSYVEYGGVVPFDQSVDVLKNYFALLFPTHYSTEGIPGTVIDAYAAGVPIISSMWESFSDLIDDNVTGIGYTFANLDGLKKVLFNIASTPNIINKMKCSCRQNANKYLPEVALYSLVDRFE